MPKKQTYRIKMHMAFEVTFYILLSLYTPKHGYAVMQFIEEKTGGRLAVTGKAAQSNGRKGLARCLYYHRSRKYMI